MTAAERARILAQIHHDGPSTIGHVATALGMDPRDVENEVFALANRGLLVGHVPVGGAFKRTGWHSIRLYQTTDKGALEATGGAQMSLAPRPTPAYQPALFT